MAESHPWMRLGPNLLLVFPAAQSGTCMGIPKEVWYLNVLGVSYLFLSCCLMLYNFLWYKGSQCNKCFPGACSGALTCVLRRQRAGQRWAGHACAPSELLLCDLCLQIQAPLYWGTGCWKVHRSNKTACCENVRKYSRCVALWKIQILWQQNKNNFQNFRYLKKSSFIRTDQNWWTSCCFFCVKCCLHSMELYFFTTCKLL